MKLVPSPRSLVLLSLGLLLPGGVVPAATPVRINVQADRPAHLVSPMLWGIFFEDINLSADGGVYAELIRNRSFEDTDKLQHWTLLTPGSSKGSMAVTGDNPMAADPTRTRNRRALCLAIESASSENPVAVANEGYWGVPVKAGATYDLRLGARASAGFGGPLVVSLQSKDGKVLASQKLPGMSENWQQFQGALTPDASDPQARLVISATAPGKVWLDMVSLFPRATWKGHGLRPDLMEMLAGLKPAFVRFPGGCWVEGDTMREAYRWKETVGEPAERRTQWNIWGYWATHGLGYHEYLQMCEDLGAEPLFVVNCGMSHKENIPMDQLLPYVQDALDAIEYANGPTNTLWGGLRAKHGHPAPFNLKYLEIGNENGGPAYHERYPAFYHAIKERYPDMHLIANDWGGIPKDSPVEVVDEHYYDTPEFFIAQAGKYDNRDRKGPKVYIGEYAVTRNTGQGSLRGAIGEAAFMLGMERNSDLVAMSSYAPLFVHVNHRHWNPDLINFDNSSAFGIPSYFVQQMFAQNRGDVVLPTTVQAEAISDPSAGRGGVGVGTWLTSAEFKDLKVAEDGQTLFASDFANGTKGWKLLGDGTWKTEDAVLRQSKIAENVRALTGEKTWSNYIYTLKARKLGGQEGFLIPFAVQDDNAKCWWNIGGWGNSRHGLEAGGVTGESVPGKIETGQWYDIRIELGGDRIRCYLDDKLIHDTRYPSLAPIHASATRDHATGELILKVVNVLATPVETEIALAGFVPGAKPATLTVLTAADPMGENSLKEPRRIAPVTSSQTLSGASWKHSFPGNSLTILRVPAK